MRGWRRSQHNMFLFGVPGYVCFSTREEATKAVTEMMGRMVPGNSKPLFVVSHESKEERRIRLEKQMQQQQQQQATQVQQMGMRMPMAGNMYGAPMMYYVSAQWQK